VQCIRQKAIVEPKTERKRYNVDNIYPSLEHISCSPLLYTVSDSV